MLHKDYDRKFLQKQFVTKPSKLIEVLQPHFQ